MKQVAYVITWRKENNESDMDILFFITVNGYYKDRSLTL